MRKIFAIWLCTLLLMSSAIVGYGESTEAATVGEKPLFSGSGSGTIADPYLITDADQLQEMNLALAAHYALGNNIDATATASWNSGEGFIPVGTSATRFTGTFNGRNFTITGLCINRPSTDYVGLFGYKETYGSKVSNISLTGVSISGRTYVGALVGYQNGGSVTYVHSSGNIAGSGEYAGGLIGYTYYGALSDSSSSAKITGFRSVGGVLGICYGVTVSGLRATGDVTGTGDNTGGLVGYLRGGISNSCATGKVTGVNYVGGLVGNNYDNNLIEKSYAAGNVSGMATVGGLAGSTQYSAEIRDSYSLGDVTRRTGSVDTVVAGFLGMNFRAKVNRCYSTGKVIFEGTTNPTNRGFVGYVDTGAGYQMTGNFWDTQTSLQTTTLGAATGKTTPEMMHQATYVGWDFSNIWAIHEGSSYPFLLSLQSGQTDDVDNDWKYKKPVTISSTGTALTNYQVQITVNFQTGMQPDFDDLRFTSADGITLIDYWLESKTNLTTAKVWVEVPAIPATGGTTIYMYFGNDAAYSVSNGTATFVFFDDFLGTALDPAKWAESSNSGTYSVSGSVLTTTSSGGCELIKSVSTFSARNMAFHTRARSTGSSGYFESYLTNFDPSGDPYGYTTWYRFVDGYNYGEQIARYSSSGQSELYRASTSHFTSWTHMYMSIGSSTIALGWDESQKATESCAFGAGDALRFDIGQWGGSSAYYDWAFVSKYATPSPTATFGYAQLQDSVRNVNTGEYFDTIQAGIDDADTLNGHTLSATSWTYYEKLTVNKRLTIQGAGMGNTTINGGGSGNVVTITANWVNITGFKITGSGVAGTFPLYDAGIRLTNVNNCTISYNNLTGNRNGITISVGGRHTVSHNQIRTSSYDGILTESSTYNRIDNNTIVGFSDSGIWLRTASSNGIIENNTISTGSYGLYISSGATPNTVIKWNTITKTTNQGMYLSGCTGSKITWNQVRSNTGTGITLSGSSSNSITNNTLLWNNGTAGGVALEGGAANNIVSYNNFWNNIRNGIRFASSGSGNRVIYNNFTNNAKSGSVYDAAIHLYQYSDYNIIANNTLFDNRYGLSGGIGCDYNTFDNNTVTYTTAWGIMLGYSNYNTFKYNTVSNGLGGGVASGNAEGNIFIRNNITSNTGNGIYIGQGGYHKILNNTITHNGVSGINITGSAGGQNTPLIHIDGNNVSYNNWNGIALWDQTTWTYHVYQTTVSNNIVIGNARTGIDLAGSTYKNTLRGNNVTGNQMQGISLRNAPDTTVLNNTVSENVLCGIYVSGTSSSKIYHNNIIGNTNQAFEDGDNIWNLAYSGGGNYWSDWISPDDFSGEDQNVAGADGFVDVPRAIPGGSNQDNYPWTAKNSWIGYEPTTGPIINVNTGEFFFLIQEAIDDPDTLNGHTLTVAAGMYFENIAVNKRLTIIGDGAGVTTIKGGGTGDVVTITSSWVNISGFKITNGGSAGDSAGIRFSTVQYGNISACNITGNLKHGIFVNSGSINTICDSTISANAANGIYLSNSPSNRIIGNTVEGNLGPEGGVYLYFSSQTIISGNIIRNHPQSGVMGYYADYNQISWNTLTNNSKATSGYVYRSAIHLYQYSDYNRINNNTLTDNRIALGTQLSITYNVWDNNTVAYSSSSGMILSYASYNTVKYSTFHHNAGSGIGMGNSDHNSFSRNNIYSNTGSGISFSQGGYHKILNNTIVRNGNSGVNMTGSNAGDVRLCHVDGNNISYNNWNGIDLYDSTSWSSHVFYENITNNIVIGNNRTGINLVGGTYTNTLRGNVVRNNLRGGIYLNNAPNCKILSNTLTYNTNDGLGLFSSSGITATGNNASSNGASGFILYSATSCALTNNTVSLNFNFGLNIGTSSNGNTITGNNASANSLGIYISWNSNSNIISKNRANLNTADGAYIDKSSSNTVFNNTFSGNSRWGLWFGWSGSSNKVYHNNFVANNGGSAQAEDNMGTNLWDNGYPGGGNYWSDYPGTDAFSGASQNVPGSDGFGDTAYVFSGSQDRYPLMFQSVWWAEVAPAIKLVTPADGSVIQAGTLLDFYVWDQNFNLDSATYAVGAGPDTAFGVNYDIDTAGWADGDYSVRVDADDKLGNTAQQTFSFRIDSTDPIFTVGTSVSIDVGGDGCIDTGDAIAIWVNVTDLNEDATTVPSIDFDETDFQDQPVDALAYQGSGVWTCTYTFQAGGFNISDVDVSFADMAGNLASAPDSVTFSIRGSKQMGFTSGWNLISFPMDSPVINGAPIRRASDLANQTSPVMISKWNPTTQSYVNFIPGFHLPTDPQNFAIGPDDAIFVFKSSAVSYSASGYKAPGQRSVDLLHGWNLVGYHAMTVGDVETDWAAQVSCGAMDDICYWDGTTFQHYIFAGTVMELTPGRGYFIWSDIATTLTY